VKFDYKRLLNCGVKCYFPDSTLGKLLIEYTFWYDIEEKAKELSLKIANYRKLNLQTIIVTTDRFSEKYSALLTNRNVRVITPNQLTSWLDGNLGE
jgi:hypothetical protein